MAALATVFLAFESGEVVVLHSRGAAGEMHETRLWVVDHEDHAWLRTGNDQNAWLLRVTEHPEIELTRGDQTGRYLSVRVEDAGARDTINRLVLEKYGFAEEVIRALGLDPARAIPVRLDPA